MSLFRLSGTMKKINQYLHLWLFLCLLMAAGCDCKNKLQGQAPKPEGDLVPSPPKQTGIWHTGDPWKVLKPTPPKASQVAHLYNHSFQVYRVTHDGSCGFRSFIPILLASILKNNEWKTWIDKMRTTYYEPAVAILSTLNLAGTKYEQFRTSDNPIGLLVDTENLLQRLAQEPKPRPLQEPEIQLLVDFLRQTLLMDHIVGVDRDIKTGISPMRILEAIDNFFDVDWRSKKAFWADANDFLVFEIPYIGLFEQPSFIYINYYVNESEIYQDVDENGKTICMTEKFPAQAPAIFLYHHDRIFYEYMVVTQVNNKTP